MDLTALKQSVKDIIQTGKVFNIKFYVIDAEIEAKVEAVINTLFEEYGKTEYAGVVYTCIKELMINGCKANTKRILFEKSNLDIDEPEQYLRGMMEFRHYLHESKAIELLKELKPKDLWVNIKFTYSPDGIRIEVINNAHITKLEDIRLREKLKKAMGYEDIVQFYMDQGDEIEGAGMGIALIVILIKGMGIDASLFRIGNTAENQTFSRLEIPLTENYVLYRDMNKKRS